MVICLVTHGDFLFSELYQPLSVDLDSARNSRDWHLLVEDTAHVMEQCAHGQHDRGRIQAVPVIQEELSALVSLIGCL